MKKKIILAICLLVLLAGCNNQQQANQQKIEKPKQTSIESSEKETNTVEPQVKENVYKNEEYGFELKLTNNWKDLIVLPITNEEYDFKEIFNDNPITNLSFCIPAPNDWNIENECIFQLTFISLSDYQKRQNICNALKKEEDYGIGSYYCNEPIAQNSTQVVLREGGVQDSSDKGSKAIEEIDELLNSFRFIKN